MRGGDDELLDLLLDRSVVLENLRHNRRQAPSVQARMVKADDELKRIFTLPLNVKANQRRQSFDQKARAFRFRSIPPTPFPASRESTSRKSSTVKRKCDWR